MGRHYVRRRNEPSLLEQRVRYYMGDADADVIASALSLLRRVRSLDERDRLPKRLTYDVDRFMEQEIERRTAEELEAFLRSKR